LGADYTDNTGYAVIITDPIVNPQPVDLVVTAYNKIPSNATIPLGDTIPPVIMDIAHSPASPVMGDMVNITCTITDLGGVDTVEITLLDPENISTEESMVRYQQTNTYYYTTTCQLPGDYHITIWANDTSGNAVTSSPYVFKVQLVHSYNLYAGWNLLTLPVAGGYTAESLGQNITGCTVICQFDGDSQSYMTHVVGIPYNDFPIEPGVGYFIYIPSNTTATVTGYLLGTIDLPIYNGWDLIGWFQGTNTDANTLGQTIEGTTVVCWFNAQTQTYTTHVVSILYANFVIERGMGLFIYTLADSNWDGDA